MEQHLVTVQSLTGELEEARELAMKIEQPAPAISATMGKAKIHGLITDKAEHAGPGGKPLIPDMSEMDIARRLAFGLLLADAEKKT